MSQLVAKELIKSGKWETLSLLSVLVRNLAFPKESVYCASKGGLGRSTKGVAYDLTKYGIRLSNMPHRYMLTAMTGKNYNDSKIRVES